MSRPEGGNGITLAGAAAERVFDPEATRAMGLALVGACWALGPASMSSDVKAHLARMIIDLAAQGERDPGRLRTGALRSVAS
ncbi:MAG TPA: hypothetical protein VLX44_16770 [Xanthobacteraceae bacterium]|nr:hypothetical protein [Xanthobacteraceae bacterium]